MTNYTQLSLTERRRLYVFLEMGLTIKEIAQRLSRHKSTIYREMNRNKEPEGYFPVIAQEKSEKREAIKRVRKVDKDGILRDYITKSLKKG